MSWCRAWFSAWWLRLGVLCLLLALPAWAGGGPGPGGPSGGVVVGEEVVVVLRASDGTASAAERARQANRHLAASSKQDTTLEVSVTREAASAVVAVDGKAVLRLLPEDAAGETTLEGLAEQVADDLERALLAEQRRARVANDVLSISLVVLCGLVAFFGMRALSGWARRARTQLDQRQRLPALRVRDVELIGPEMTESVMVVALWLLRWLGQVAILYTWLVVSLSLFRATRAYSENLTGLFIAPLSQLTTRVAALVPLLVLVGIAALAVFVLVRFVGVFFASVAKRETSSSWVPPDLANTISILLRLGIVVTALLFLGPVVAGEASGTLTHLGFLSLGAVALGSTPLLASALVGMVVVLRRQLRVGDYVAIGASTGRISKLSLLEVRLEDEHGAQVRIPPLALLRTAIVVLGDGALAEADVLITARGQREACEQALIDGASELGDRALCTLLEVSPSEWRYRVAVRCKNPEQGRRLVSVLATAITQAGHSLVCAQARGRPVL